WTRSMISRPSSPRSSASTRRPRPASVRCRSRARTATRRARWSSRDGSLSTGARHSRGQSIDPRTARLLTSLRPASPMARTHRQPISARHAFARAFDLAVRRDPVQSLWVPLLLHAPWLLLKALVPSPDDPGGHTVRNLQLNSLQLLGDFPVSLLIASMLRFRALSVHASADGLRPAPVLECYARGARRMPWLFATELLRNVAIVAGLVAVLPAFWVGFRFSLATEVAVLRRT